MTESTTQTSNLSNLPEFDPIPLLVDELKLPRKGIAAVIGLLKEGNTVPFIARYRKEATGDLDEVQIRSIEERNQYLDDLDKRRQTILTTIDSQGKLDDKLKATLLKCTSKTELEDLYLPYKPKRRTKATIAREKGLEPLALGILSQSDIGSPYGEALELVDEEKGVPDAEAALAGARDIVAEVVAENAEVRALVRKHFTENGFLHTTVHPSKEGEPTKFEQYYDYREQLKNMPSHRFLAILRGEKEEILRVKLEVETDPILSGIRRIMGLNPQSPYAHQLELAIDDSYKRLQATSVETDVRVDMKLRSDNAAVEVFARNLRQLLLAAPLGENAVVGIDPGIRTGCKCAAIDATGRYLDTITIYPQQGAAAAQRAEQDLLAFVGKHRPRVVGVGNGTAGRETEQFAKTVLKQACITDIPVVPVNESGASVYSASDIAREEFPELDLTIRGAISIARRLQDPLAELVKIDPKAIGVGQYQHDVYQPLLQHKLDDVVESCVNHVGVELNTASAPLLSRVAGIGPKLAKAIVDHREAAGAFKGRKQLLKVAGLGPRTFVQAAGFLRVPSSM